MTFSQISLYLFYSSCFHNAILPLPQVAPHFTFFLSFHLSAPFFLPSSKQFQPNYIGIIASIFN